MEEGHKDADLNHVHKLCVEGLPQDELIVISRVQDLLLVLVDQEGDCYAFSRLNMLRIILDVDGAIETF